MLGQLYRQIKDLEGRQSPNVEGGQTDEDVRTINSQFIYSSPELASSEVIIEKQVKAAINSYKKFYLRLFNLKSMYGI